MWIYACAVAGAVVLYEASSRVRYVVRYAFMYGWALAAGACCIPQGLLYRPCDLRNGARFVWPLRFVSWLLGVRWHVRGADILRERPAAAGDTEADAEEDGSNGVAGGGAIVVSNHQSAIDVLGLVQLWPTVGRLASVIKREVWLGLPFALAAWLCGQIFIDRRRPAVAKQQLAAVAERVLAERFKLWVFPEGTRGDGRRLLPFKKGAFHLAVQAGLPVVPVVFSSYTGFLRSADWFFGSGDVIVQVLPPISTRRLGIDVDADADPVGDLATRTRDLMQGAFDQLNAELESGSYITS